MASVGQVEAGEDILGYLDVIKVVAGGVLDARRKEERLADGQMGKEVVELLDEADAQRADAVDEDVAAVGLA